MREKTSSKSLRSLHSSILPSHFYLLNHLFIASDCCMYQCVCFWNQWHSEDIFLTVSNNVFFFDRGSTKFDFQCQMLALPSVLLTTKICKQKKWKRCEKKQEHTMKVLQWRWARGSRQTPSPPPPYCHRCHICVNAQEHKWENDVWWGWGFSGKIANQRDAQWKWFLRFDIDTSYINRKESQKFLIVFCTLQECTYTYTFKILSVFC